MNDFTGNLVDETCSLNIDSWVNPTASGLKWGTIDSIRGSGPNRSIMEWFYGDGDYNRPHSLQVKFYIKF